MSSLEKNIKPYSKAIVKLLKAPIESSASLWETVNNYQTEIQEYVSLMGLELMVKKDDGFAYLRQFEDSDGNTLGLISRRQVGYEITIILVVLRQSLEEFDSNPAQFDVNEKYISRSNIKEELELFLEAGYNELKFQKELDGYINKIVELGYLKEVSKTDSEVIYKIHRIIKEKVTLDVLKEFKNKLQHYVESV
ncbi:DUF4194 domain-containing protein [Arenibacter sp. 6A1]|uniref:DUF4194 domain-containing protein n=1 Tax=Arenibacter sp. 6A1 TaxID=2720391 RepID=UPI00144606CA|nr:DUF4194 domain-containing protein [Arenibacter sp. 6A1]NKI27132.1 DUF4194 domain-containing protein [Arenibacter sp. 6A1]